MALLSIIIPTKNSASYIRNTLAEVEKVIDSKGWDAEVIVVNDGGCMQVRTEVIAAKEHFKNLTYIGLSQLFGQQLAVRAGLDVAKGKYLLTFDDDLQYQTTDIPRLFDYIQNHPELKIVCGHSAYKRHRGIYSFLSRITVSLLEGLFFRKFRNAHYFTSFKIFDRQVLQDNEEGMKNIYFFWDFNPAEIGFLEVPHYKRTIGETGYNLLSYIKFFRHIILRMSLQVLVLFSIVWMILGWMVFTTTQVLIGGAISLCLGMVAVLILSKLKHRRAHIKEVIA